MQEVNEALLSRVDPQGRKMIRQSEGKLGATMRDSDIYRVGEGGVPQFFNPDTNLPFTGDNPRAQAQAWVDVYNNELREVFNQIAGDRQAEIEKEIAPQIQLLEFTPTYEKLDKPRQQMLDALLEDYEVYDKAGDHIGYSVDLNAALRQVNRQVTALQAGKQAVAPAAPPAAATPVTGPALDMPTSGGGGGTGKPVFKSEAEAMEWLQDQEIAKLRDKTK